MYFALCFNKLTSLAEEVPTLSLTKNNDRFSARRSLPDGSIKKLEWVCMLTESTQRPSNVLTARTCSRCGRGFGALAREYTCPHCKAVASGTEPARPAGPHLSSREKQIVHLIQQAKSNKEIAYMLCLTVGTVKEYLYHIFRKPGVSNRTELALWGRGYLTNSEMAS